MAKYYPKNSTLGGGNWSNQGSNSVSIDLNKTPEITINDLMPKCPKCGSFAVTKELVAYAYYDAPSVSKSQKRCLLCGWTKEDEG